jgi:hypothetical protein
MAWQPVALVDFCAISNAKIPIIGTARTFGSIGICRKKSLDRRFLGVLRAKHNKLLVACPKQMVR